MFGFSFGEIMVLLIVGVVVVGPRRLPTMMRTAGRWVAKLRRMTTDLRSQSGIDDLIRQEGLEREIRELRALSRVNVIETLVTPVVGAVSAGSVVSATPKVKPPPEPPPLDPTVQPLRSREYPELGCDAYDADIADDLPAKADPGAVSVSTAAPAVAAAPPNPAAPAVAAAPAAADAAAPANTAAPETGVAR